MVEVDLKQVDPSGLETLELFSGAHYFNRWMYEEIAPFCKGATLEIGSGIGNISALLLQHHDKVALSDLKPDYCRILEQTFGNHSSLLGVHTLDLASPHIARDHPGLIGGFDTIVALNVVEHIEDHERAIANCRELLKPGGQLVVLVPAYQWLYNVMDEELGHFRRYRERDLAGLLSGQGLKIIHTQYFNAIAIVGWWVTGSLLKARKLKRGPLSLYNKMAPALRLADWLLLKKIGVSVIAVARK